MTRYFLGKLKVCTLLVLVAVFALNWTESLAQEPECFVFEGELICWDQSDPEDPIAPANTEPTITVIPALTMVADQPFAYQIAASDADGDTLTYSLLSQPTWLSIGASDGVLSGTPTAIDVGSYADITVLVTDGNGGSASQTFTVDVTSISVASVSLSWTAPTARDDGSALTNLTGFNIYSGRSSDTLQLTLSIDNPSVSTAQIDDLGTGLWYFAMTAFDSDGIESEYSNVITRTVP